MSESATALQAVIQRLSADIETQKEVLRNLEQRKSTAQRQLNEILDPIARLPLDLSSEIFLQCLPIVPKPVYHNAPMLLLNICNTWSSIALATTALWDSVQIHGRRNDAVNLLNAWIARAQGRTLSIRLHGHITSAVAAIVGRNVAQLHDFQVYDDEDGLDFVVDIGPFPALKTLAVGGFNDDWGVLVTPRPEKVLAMLHVSPNVVECTFTRIYGGQSDSPLPEVTPFPHIQHVNFRSSGVNQILQCISLPGLRTLLLPLVDVSVGVFDHFLRRSSPPLQRLTLHGRVRLGWTDATIEQCLFYLPTLTQPELVFPENVTAEDVVAVLSRSPHVLPLLSSVSFCNFDPKQAWYRQLLNALLIRRTKITAVQVVWTTANNDSSESDIYLSLQQLVSEGMVVHIGPEGINRI
ncbi:hypothetical protein C8R43DRAFT_1044285 [Mycena crocata]|nr:hypothetical protein C8R43DRAFT_1044285 [Mycena crocata]